MTVWSAQASPTLGCFRDEYPGVSIDLEVASSVDVIQRLLTGRVQLAIVGAVPDDERLAAQPFCEDEIVGVAKPGVLAVDEGTVTAAALSAETLLAGEPGSGTQALADEELKAAGVDPTTVWRLDHGTGSAATALPRRAARRARAHTGRDTLSLDALELLHQERRVRKSLRRPAAGRLTAQATSA